MDLMTLLRSQWDRVAACACVLLGLVLLVLGYEGVASSPYVAQELSYLISGGLGGLFFLAVGATLYISADMHDEWRKLDRIEDAIRSLQPPAPEQPRGETVPAAEPVELGELAPKPARRGRRAAQVLPGTARVDSGLSLRQSVEFIEHGSLAPLGVTRTPQAVMDSLRVSSAWMALGALGLALAYTRAANVSQAKPAITATALGVVALIVVGLGSASGTLGLRRRLTIRRGAMLIPFLIERGWTPSAAPTSATASGGELRIVEGGSYAHEPSCAMLHGQASTSVRRDELPADVRICALCAPPPAR